MLWTLWLLGHRAEEMSCLTRCWNAWSAETMRQVVRADGSAALEIGETVLDVLPGTTFAHDEQLAAIRVDPNRKKEKGTQSRDADGAERAAEGECAFLGRVPGRLVCVPNVDSLLRASGEST